MTWEKDNELAFERVYQEHKRQHEILHSDPPRRSREVHEATAFSLGLSSEELSQEIETNEAFREIYKLALERKISYQEAKDIYGKTLTSHDRLLDKISNYQNSSQPRQPYPKEPGPPRIFTKFHKPHKKPTKEQLVKKAEGYMRWKEASDAVNTEEATPLD